MIRYLKIPQYFGQATEVLYYNPRCQFESIEYYRKIRKTKDGKKVLVMDGDKDYILAKFSSKAGWFPQVGSTFFLKFAMPKDSGMYAKNFAVFGSGDMNDIANNDFWGLVVKTDPLTRSKIFYLTISNMLQMAEIPFRGFTFSPDNFPEEVFNTITLIQNSNYAQLYVNGNFVSQVNLPFVPETRNLYQNIYIGSYGSTTEYPGMKIWVKELGLWERPIDTRDILDLHDKNFVENKGVSKTAKRVKIEAGKFYYDGYIHSIDESSIFITGEGSEIVYIQIKESLITEEEDPELLDNSTNTYNLGKPGMHRIKYEYSYGINIDTATLDENTFVIKFLEFNNGVKVFSLLQNETTVAPTDPTSPSENNETSGKETPPPVTNKEILDLISKYLYEMLGNFIFSGLSVSMQDKDQNSYQVTISSGVYYLNGRRYEVDKNILLDVNKNASLTSIVNEYIHIEPNKPILLAQQPVAGKYYFNNNLVSGVTRALVPTKQTKNIHVSRMDPYGEDFVDSAAIKVLAVYKGTDLAHAAVVYKPCSTVDGPDGDYYFYNGKIKWSPFATNKPMPAVNGISVDTYVVEYVKMYSCVEGVNNDFVVIKGDRLNRESLSYGGRYINNILQYTAEHIISASVDHNGTKYILDTGDLSIRGNYFVIEKDYPYLTPGDTIEVYYSYNSDTSVKPLWHILFFETGTKIIDTSVDGIVDYKYYLSDIYTLAIDIDNVFRLYKGIPGYRGNTIKTAIPDTSLPIVDILIDPDGSQYCKITPYDIYRTHVLDIRNLMKKVTSMEESIAMTELEKLGESKATDINKLKGMFVDSLANYLRADISKGMDAFIDIVRERLYSGYNRTQVALNIKDWSNVRLGREVLYPYMTDKTEVTDYQLSYTSEDSINKYLLSKTGPQISVLNDYSYDTEYKTPFVEKVLDSIYLSTIPTIPVSSDISIMSSYINESTVSSDRSAVIKKLLDKFKTFFEAENITTIARDKDIIVVGRGFEANESGINLQINGRHIAPEANMSPIKLTTDTTNGQLAELTDSGLLKKIKVCKLKHLSGWLVTPAGIRANENGEFVVRVSIDYTNYTVTGFPKMVIKRSKFEDTELILNFNSSMDALRNVINTGSRGNTTFFDSQTYSSNVVPGLLQPIKSKNMTITEMSVYFSYIDFSSPLVIDFCEMENSSITKVLSRRFIKNLEGFDKISGDKYTIKFETPINLSDSKNYCISLATENSAVKVKTTEIGKPSKSSNDLNLIVSRVNPLHTVVSVNKTGIVTSLDSKKGLCYEIVSPDLKNLPINTDGFIENIIYFDPIEFTEKQDRFCLCVDNETNLSYDRQIYVEYSTDPISTGNQYKKWIRVIPYSISQPKEKFDRLSIRFVLLSKNTNFIPKIPQYPLVISYKFKDDSSYYSKTFETGIETGTDESYVDIHLNSETRANSSYDVKISPDNGMSWKDCSLLESKILGNTSQLTLKEETYRYDCRLSAPIVESHEVIPFVPGSLTNGNFDNTMYVSYLVTSLDANHSAITINEVYNINKTTKLPETYLVNNLDGLGQKIKLKIQLDSNSRGFRIYRSINGAPEFTQIYSSIATTSVPGSITQAEIDPYRIPSVSTSEFPKKGIIKINNELIKYEGISGNMFMVSDREYLSTTLSLVRPGDKIELYDFAGEQENILNGQMPKLYSTKKYFEFIDDNITYPVFAGRLAVPEDRRLLNQTISYPQSLSVKIGFTNSAEAIESSSIFNLIVNVQKK